MKMRVADFLVEKIHEAGAENPFLVTGGMIMFLTDALVQKKESKFTCCHHEQSCVMAAEAYGRYTGKLGAAYVTAGPAALNTLNSVVGALVDRSPTIVVAGQSKVPQAKVTGPRQFALQGFNTLPIFEQVTKYAVMLDDVKTARYHIEKAIYLAKQAPVGPVWIECPIDIQGAMFDPDEHEGFTPNEEEKKLSPDNLPELISQMYAEIKQAKKPCILAGAGVRAADAVDEFNQLVKELNIPVTTSRMGMDIIDHENSLFVGRPGTYGDRPGNFTVQNADLLIVMGNRMGIGLIGHDYQGFSPNSRKIFIDIDRQEHEKPSVNPDISIVSDLKIFLNEVLKNKIEARCENTAWVEQTQLWKKKYPVNLPEYKEETEGINSYHFMDEFSRRTKADDVFLVDTGSCFHVHAQAFKVKMGQRHIITGGLSTMGYMPAVIGPATVASAQQNIYCITGDGSVQMNIQEFQTLVTGNHPVKIILFNNNGYLLIRHSQNNFCEGRLMGEGPETGVGFPDLEKLSAAYGLGHLRIENLNEMNAKLDELDKMSGPVICEVITPSKQLLVPRVSSKRLEDGTFVSMAYDDMFPFLDRDEYESNKVNY